jgi:GT2 family glycosyltransferase
LQEEGVKCGGGQVRLFFKSERPNIYEYFDAARKLNQKAHIEKAGFAATANFFVRRELFDRYGLFRSDMISGGDYEFGRRLTKRGERIVYIPDAVVCHPARSTLKAILKKSKRVAIGQKALEKEGLLDHGRVSFRRLMPRLSVSIDPAFSRFFSRREILKLIMMQNFIVWLNFLLRMG